MNNLGIHIYDQFADLKWEEEILLFNLMSALTWKKYMGTIDLYCNTNYLMNLKKYNIDSLYNNINTEILDNKPNNIDYNQYWAFSKLIVLEKIKAPFTLIDTDLYIKDKLVFNTENKVTFYHKENFSLDYERNVYIDFDLLIPDHIKSMKLDKNVLPNNTAILNVNDDTFISDWVNLSKEIAIYNKDIKVEHPSTKICFVEQRLLPILLEKKGIKYSTIIKSIYQSHLSNMQNGDEWIPSSSLLNLIDPEEHKRFFNIKHLWGIKAMFENESIRNKIMNIVIDDFENFLDIDNKFEKIYKKISKKYKRKIKF